MPMSTTATLAGAIPASNITRRTIRQVDLAIKLERERLAMLQERADTKRAWLIRRADLVWDADHRDRAENLASKIKSQPGRVVARLTTTYHGCLFLMHRWSYLHQKVVSKKFKGELSKHDHMTAHSLLGFPADEWDNEESELNTDAISRDDPDWEIAVRKQLRELFMRELRRLTEIMKVLDLENKEAQAEAKAGEFFDTDPFLNKTEREINNCERRIRVLEKERLLATKEDPQVEVNPSDSSASTVSADAEEAPVASPLL